MPAVGAGEIIVWAQGQAGAHRHGFLADAGVKRAADLALLVQVADGFFKFADDVHLAVSASSRLRF